MNGSSSNTTTIVVTEVRSVFNSTTGEWVNVTTTRNSTFANHGGSSFGNCSSNNSSSSSNSTLEGWKAFVYFKENMQKWDFKEWVMYLKSVSDREWNFGAFVSKHGNDSSEMSCDGSSRGILQITNIMNIFEVLKAIEKADDRDEACSWLKASIHANYRHQQACMDDEDDDSRGGMDSSDSQVMTSRLRATNNAEMGSLGEILCSLPFKGNRTVWTDEKSNETCNLWAIRNIVLASVHIKLGWDDDDSCKEATMALSYLKYHLEPCNSRLRFLLATLIRQAEMRQRMVCTPPTCNIPYASTCALDAEMRLVKFMDQNGGIMNGSIVRGSNQPGQMPSGNRTNEPMMDMVKGFCRNMKITMACVANHTISCGNEEYSSVNMRVKHISEQFRKVCSDFVELPPNKCTPPPAMPVGRDEPDDKEQGERGDQSRGEGNDNSRGGDDESRGEGNDQANGGGNGTRGGEPGDRIDMGNMPMPSSVELIKRMAKYSIFNDGLICQNILSMPETHNNSQLLTHFCGMKDVEDQLFCLNGTYENGTFTNLDVEKCDAGAVCRWSLHPASNVESMGCSTPSECYVAKGRCCGTDFCNTRIPAAPQDQCQCDLPQLKEYINETMARTNSSQKDCLDNLGTVHALTNGCPDYTRNVLASKLAVTALGQRCSSIDLGGFIDAPPCGKACPSMPLSMCYSYGFSPCSHSFTKCLAALTAGCSENRMLQVQHARMVKAKNMCSNEEKKTIMKYAASSKNEIVSSGYEMANTTFACYQHWMMNSSNMNDTEVLMGLNKCLNNTKLPMSLIGKKFQIMVSSLASGIAKLKHEEKVEGECFERSNMTIKKLLKVQFEEVLSGNTESCSEHIKNLKGSDCPEEMKHFVFSVIVPNCADTWIRESNNCSHKGIEKCFSYFLRAPVKNWEKLAECLNKTTSTCEPHIVKAISFIAHGLAYVDEKDSQEKPGDGYNDDDKDDEDDDDDDDEKPMTWSYNKESVDKYYGNSSCVCDPALAVHCIFEVHHLSKQDDPDWEGLCPLVNKSGICAHRYVQGCDECQKNTVKEIVSKLNYGLRKTCEKPPESECRSIKAMDCVTNLMEYHKANSESNKITTCVEISKTKKCIEENLKGCEQTTEMKVNRLLSNVIDRWEGLECESPVDRLGTCRDLFENDVDRILSFDMDAMFSDLETNKTERWDEFQERCERMRTAWTCVDETLELDKDRRGSNIIKDSLKAVYLSIKKICTSSNAPLQCYECSGEGSRSCSSGASIDMCKSGSVCQTVTDQGSVKSRGCTPRPSCKPGCKNDKCTYCCSEARCNDLDNGPIAGSCNKQAMSKCIFDLSRQFIGNDEFSCSSVELALDCLSHEQMQCQMGGVSFSLEEISTASLKAQVQVCLLKEADQTCTIQPIATTASFVSTFGMHIDEDSLCSIVANNRRSLRIAEMTCTEDQTKDVKRNVKAFEDSLGFLDCSNPHGFIVGTQCRISDAIRCFERLDMNMEENSTLSCENATALANCIKRNLMECQSSWYTLPIKIKFSSILRQKVKESCDVKIIDGGDGGSSGVDIEKCLNEFTNKMQSSNVLESVLEAAEELQDCIYDLNSGMILALNSVQKLYLEAVSNFIEIIVDNNVTVIGPPPDSVSMKCAKGLNYLARHHFLDAITLPLIVTKDVPNACRSLDFTIQMVTKEACAEEVRRGNAFLEHVFKMIDMLREKIVVGFCPDVEPIPRCLVTRAEQCLARFSAYTGPGSNSSLLCTEARSLVKCARSFAATCTDAHSLVAMKSQSSFALEAITQVCYDDPRLVAEARCLLLRQVDSQPGCNSTALSQCGVITDNTTCPEVEKETACFVKGAGTCLPDGEKQQPEMYQNLSKQLQKCRPNTWSDGSPRDTASLFRPCGQAPGTCNVNAAAGCLSKLVNFISQDAANITEGVTVARACLEKNFNCFSSVITLLSSNITEYSKLLVHVLQITPSWTKIESNLFIRLLNLPSFVMGALEKTPAVNLNLWDICWNLDQALSVLIKTNEDFPNMDLTSFKYSTENLKFTIQSLCNNFGAVAEMLQFPQQENPTCAAPAIRAKVKILLSRSIAEFYTNQEVGAKSVCSAFMSLNASLSANLQASPLSLDDCSDGLRAQTMFSMHAIHLMIRSQCEMAQSGGSPRCSITDVAKCVRRLYNKLMLLGISQTEENICSELEEAQDCVKRFSFRCDDSRMGRVGWMWRSVSRAAQMTCEQEKQVSICNDDMDPDHASCDLRKAGECSRKQYRNFINPFIRKEKRCRYLSKNMECIQTYTKNCGNVKLPKMFMLDPDEVEEIQERLGCKDEDIDNTFGCRKGCMIDSAQACLATFQSTMTMNMWGLLNSKTCSLINDMRFCVATHTKTCTLKERRGVYRALDKLLEKFPKHHEACVDVATCAANFDSLVRQIEGLPTDKDSDYDEDMYGNDDDCDEDDDEGTKPKTCDKDKKPKTQDKDTKPETEDKDTKPETEGKDTKPQTEDKDTKPKTQDKDTKPATEDKDTKPATEDKDTKPATEGKDTKPETEDKDDKGDKDDYDDGDTEPAALSLEALCSQVRQVWTTCLKPGLMMLPKGKSDTVIAMYESIWAAMEEKCKDTTQLKCYMCKQETATGECEKEIETCPHNKKACLFQQSLANDEIRYSAGCANPKSCYNNGDGNTQKSCCYGDLCNTASSVSVSPVSQEPETCKFEYALMCALDFTMSYMSTDEISCGRSTQHLSCVQRYGQTCTSESSKALVKATNSVFLELASSSCVVDSEPGDCFSLAIFSMQAILSNAYVSEGNSPCVGLEETEASVKQTIANGNCSEAGRIGLESSLAFVRNIVGSHCQQGECVAVNWADVINGGKICSGYIFKGIKHIYLGYAELAKPESDCGLLQSYFEEAQNLLSNCKIVAFLQAKLNGFESDVQQKCGLAISSTLPPVCVGTCQTEVVIEYVRKLRSVFDNSSDSSAACLNLMQVERVYSVYTKECSSVQQKDVVKYVKSTFQSEIESCQEKDSSFDFSLEIKRDVYYQAVECQVDFQNEIGKAFEEGSQERMCKAVKDLEECQYELPNVFEDLIMGPTKDLLNLIEINGLCKADSGGQNSTSPPIKRQACDIKMLSTLIQQLLIPPNIATSSFESRDLFCQETTADFEKAKILKDDCGSSLNSFQQMLFEIMTTTVEKNNKKHCPPLRFEKDGCNLKMIGSCFKDFFTILHIANMGTESVCRQAQFSLECMARFSDKCEASLKVTANEIRKVAVRMVKDVVGNKCPALVNYLFCDGNLSTVEEGCQLDEAKQCAAEAKPELSQQFIKGYCESKQEKVDCTKRNLIGCEDDQIKSVTLPAPQLESICGISNTSLSGICRSDAECPLDEIQTCFNNSDKCEYQAAAAQCIRALLERRPRCTQSIGSYIEQFNYIQYYSADYLRCNSLITMKANNISKMLCAPEAVVSTNSLLSSAQGRADQIIQQIIQTVANCLDGKDVTNNVDVRALQQFLTSINETLETDNPLSIPNSGPVVLADNGTCSYSKAAACVSHKAQTLLYVKLLSINERKRFCQYYSEGKTADCLKKHLDSCPEDKKTWFTRVNNRVDQVIDELGLCKPPQTCIISEAYACINKFGTVISQYDRSQDKVALCTGRAQAESCIQSFTFTCTSDEVETVTSSYNELATKVNLESLCDGVELPPPPICPELPEKNRMCYMGNAFTCLFKFSINILQGDSLIWRQQCMTIQKMMTCVAKSTSGCEETDEDVKSIRQLLKEFVTKAGDQCPWLTENLCTEQAACPVNEAGCEVDLEYGLMNRQTDVCNLERAATECVTINTVTCNKAQRMQAMNVMKKKLRAAGLPGDLMCDDGNIEGHLYSFFIASGDVTVEGKKATACANYDSLYNSINAQFSNPESKEYVALAKSLIDQLYKERDKECDGRVSDECAVHFPVKSFATLITDLMVKDELHLTSFCAQARALMLKNNTSSCNSEIYNVLLTPYTSKCLDQVVSCNDAEAKIAECIASFGNSSSLSCSDQQKAAECVSTYLPSHCMYKSEWLNDVILCPEVVVLQATHTERSKQFVCEAGLYGYFGWKRVAGSENFTITINTVADDADSVPRCLKGPNENDPIPQLFYAKPRSLQPTNGEVMFKVYGREDYKQDGPQAVDVSFTVDAGSASFQLPSTKVYVSDRNIPNSACSSINDPHIRTHDGIKYNNMDTGRFILFRHKMFAEAVVVQYSQCSTYGSCNCGVKVYAGKSTVTFDLCDQNTDIVSYFAETGADTLDQQRMAVMLENDLKTYTVVLLDSGTLVKVRIEGKYMNVWVMPSAKDIGATQGLCGVYDGDGYNDFQLPDFSQYQIQKTDGEPGELVPNDFNNKWKITKAQADDYNQVFVQNVTISTDPVPVYCQTWTPGSGKDSVTKCGKWANLALCGLVNGEDQTASLLANFKQDMSSSTSRRKRQAPNPIDDVEEPTSVQTATWPTESGWTLETATAWCLDNIPDNTLQMCTDAVASLDGTLQSFQLDEQVQDCIGDIKASDGTEWLEGARISAYQHCITELNQNPGYQNNAESSNLAIQFLDATCTPPDCNGHGSCSTGTCNCYEGYYGTSCDISAKDLTPPVLKEPEDGVHMCEIDSNSDCSSVFISGSNFVSSSKLSCHYQEVKVTEMGQSEVSGSLIQVAKAQLIARDRVQCDLGDRSSMKRSLRISVSNDGVTPHSQYQLFVAYDPVCYICDLSTCTRQTDVCVIGDTCVKPGVSSIYDDCEYCNLDNPTTWTIRTELDHCKEKHQVDSDGSHNLVPLIGAGCALLALLVLAVIGLIVFLKRRDSRKQRERRGRNGVGNPTYLGEEIPFDGSPVLRANVSDDPSGKKLGLDHYQEEA
ncbi:hypothetical protein EGW08_007955 [Elysia chlorotica]|uniref:VWFD domain-containing protein n=1 Tax=Elysia chlorotica TaxID=188477 RepID=A0A433TRP0_ELYCH|nr:hypothetical protein EGW08_007955 [Elysia chlorotica]